MTQVKMVARVLTREECAAICSNEVAFFIVFYPQPFHLLKVKFKCFVYPQQLHLLKLKIKRCLFYPQPFHFLKLKFKTRWFILPSTVPFIKIENLKRGGFFYPQLFHLLKLKIERFFYPQPLHLLK